MEFLYAAALVLGLYYYARFFFKLGIRATIEYAAREDARLQKEAKLKVLSGKN